MPKWTPVKLSAEPEACADCNAPLEIVGHESSFDYEARKYKIIEKYRCPKCGTRTAKRVR